MRSLRQKLLILILPLCLVPLLGISYFSYFQAKIRITEDRITLYLEQIARSVADTIHLNLLEKREETLSMGLFFKDFLSGVTDSPPVEILNELLLIHEVYDVVLLYDIDGRILALNSISRHSVDRRMKLDGGLLVDLLGRRLSEMTPDSTWLQQIRSGRFGYIDWHQSPIVSLLYDYSDEDIALSYTVGFAAPVTDDRGVVVGGILTLMNWEYVQEILDHLEDELALRSLRSGYGFLFGSDADTVIAHKYRLNRDFRQATVPKLELIQNNYSTSLVRDHGLEGLSLVVQDLLNDPLRESAMRYAYEYPVGSPKVSGLVSIHHEYFDWVLGVGISDEDMFTPVQDLKNVLIWAALLTSMVVVVLTFWAARQMSIPVKKLTEGARMIAGGDLSERVSVATRDEIGELAQNFNEMAESLQERSQALLELNRELENKVGERTRELQESHGEVERAYEELKETQVQLIQSEKMASLGQLVAGIAHEIKNPLNFIYGNTDFLRQYVSNLKELLRIYEEEDPTRQREAARELKDRVNFEFVLGDLATLIDNFEEGAERIHSIIGDLRAFSRLDSDDFRMVDVHEPIELALNLVRQEYRDRITIHREYGELPKIECHSGRLSQVFMNLLSNACQAIVGEGNIWIRTSAGSDQVGVEIEDSGRGIEANHLNKVFEPFFTTKPVGKGTGLGLSISYGIVQNHKGTISVESPPGKGTSFRIELPVKQ